MMRVIVGGPLAGDLAWEDLSQEELLSLATTGSLLGEAERYTFAGALSGARAEEFFDMADAFAGSPHQFIFLEEKLLKKAVERLERARAEIIPLAGTKKDAPKKEAFDIFSLTYAFSVRDKKKLWLLCMEALRRGVAPEAVAGILHWKVRDLFSRRSFGGGPGGTYTQRELADISRRLVSLYHDSHRGAGDLALLLERFVLLL